MGDEDPNLELVVFDDDFVAGAAHRELSARERAAQSRKWVREGRKVRRSRRRRERVSKVRRHAPVAVFVGFVAAALAWSLSGLGDAVPADPRPREVRAVYAVPADVPEDPNAVAAIRRDIEVTQEWLAAQTGGRSLRFAESGGAAAVEIRRLAATAADLVTRPDAAALVNDEFRADGADRREELRLLFVPVEFSELVRCGEGSSGGYAIVWMGSCGATPSTGTTIFGQGSTFVIAHELIHALGAVEPCAPHYGNNGHVTDNPSDLLYDGPVAAKRDANTQLDPGRDDYYATGNPGCPDVATHPAWRNR